MKKILIFLICFLLITSFGCTGVNPNNSGAQNIVYAYDSETDRYFVKDGTRYNGTKVVIPSTYDDGVHGIKRVSKVLKEAFKNNNKIEEVYLPDNVSFIGESAFSGCINLKLVQMMGVSYIDSDPAKKYSFFGCDNLESVIVNDKFVFCNKIFIPSDNWDGVPKMSIYASKKGDSIMTDNSYNQLWTGEIYYLDIDVAEHGSWKWNNDKTAIIKSSTGHEMAFDGYCEDEDCFEVMDNKKIADYIYDEYLDAYVAKKSLYCPERVVISDYYDDGLNGKLEVVKIANDAFNPEKYHNYMSNTIKTLYISDNVTEIGERAFASCDGIELIKMSANIERIASDAFKNCSNIKYLIIKKSLAVSSVSAFNNSKKGSMDIYAMEKGGVISFNAQDNLWSGNVYYYSEDRPNSNANEYWHYVNEIPTLWS